jgi:hypothetical protein
MMNISLKTNATTILNKFIDKMIIVIMIIPDILIIIIYTCIYIFDYTM